MADYLSSLSGSRIAHVAREKEEKRGQERRRSLMYLIAEFLREHGCTETAESLAKEAQLSGDYQVCDNIDLDTVLLEFSDYYYAKYNRYPKICKKVENTTHFVSNNNAHNSTRRDRNVRNIRKSEGQPEVAKTKSVAKMSGLQPTSEANFGITVTPIFQCPGSSDRADNKLPEEESLFGGERVLKPIGDLYQRGSEWRDMADMISKEIVVADLNVHWDDIEGLEECKSLLKEATVYPMKYPELFGGKLAPWQGILLYGPPGTGRALLKLASSRLGESLKITREQFKDHGKTMLAKAVATECNTTFFNISSSSIISKWRGDSEKLIRVLFELAKHHAPAVIFVDEADWTARGHGDSSSASTEPARRFRAELLARIDGLCSVENRILLLAASNLPWELDLALLRRLEKRILVDLPDSKSRFEFFRSYVQADLLRDEKFVELVAETDGYSCADLKLICKEAWMMQLRPIWQMLEENQIVREEARNLHHQTIGKLTHLQNALCKIKPTAKHVADKYKQWREKFGSS